MSVWIRAAAAALAFFPASAACAQGPSESEPDLRLLDVTGAGTLDIAGYDAVLRLFRRDFGKYSKWLDFALTINADGAVTSCKAEDKHPELAAAGVALCEHALKKARFVQYPYLALEYGSATYHFSVNRRATKPNKGETLFRINTGYPDNGQVVVFPDDSIPPEDQRLSLDDLRAVPMQYPRSALSREIEARVEVALTFGEDGRVARCRPLRSSNTTRMAYETCREARYGFRLINAPDPRPYVFATLWKIER